MSVLNVLAEAYDSARAFACVVHKPSFPNRDPMEVAFEDLCSRFDRYLGRLRASGDDQRGLVILDNSAYETTLQQMSVEFRTLGTRWGVIRRLADTPLFVDSRASRVIQLAEHVAYAVFRRYHAGIPTTLTVSPRSSTKRTALSTGWPTRNWGTRGVCAPLASLGGSTKAGGPNSRGILRVAVSAPASSRTRQLPLSVSCP